MDWIEGLPLPVGMSYLVLYLLAALYIFIGISFTTLTGEGSEIQYVLGNAVWIPVPLAVMHYLRAEAESTLAAFRAAIEWDDEAFQQVKFRFIRIPGRVVLLINGAIALLLVLLAIQNPFLIVPERLPLFIMAALLAYSTIGFSFVPIFIFQTLRQLRIVSELYAKVEHVNVFNLGPLYVLSGLTAKTAAAWIVLANLTFVMNVLLNVGMEVMDLSVTIPLLLAQVLLAILAFLVPLWGVHKRIEQDKDRVLEKNSHRLESAYRELERRMAEGDMTDMDAFQKGAMALIAFRKEIESISTWPWQPATFRGFLSAVLLPIFLFVVQQVLAGFIAP
jgi:hypothetical protein